MTAPQAPAGWYADPAGKHEKRWFDGQQWTEHVNSHGRSGVDPIGGPSHVPTVNRDPAKVQRDVQRASQSGARGQGQAGQGQAGQGQAGQGQAGQGQAGQGQAGQGQAGQVPGYQPGPGGGSLFDEPILVVNQKAKFIEVSNEYAIYDQHARQLGAVREVGQSTLKKAVRLLSSYDQYLTHKLQIVDMTGTPVLALTRPAKLIKSRILVETPNGQPVGEIVQQNAIGKIRFGLESGGNNYGLIQGENWRAWNFAILDHTGSEVARITKTWEGLAKTMFTTADNYVVHIHRPLQEPLRSLVVAAAVSIDTALKQDSRGWN